MSDQENAVGYLSGSAEVGAEPEFRNPMSPPVLVVDLQGLLLPGLLVQELRQLAARALAYGGRAGGDVPGRRHVVREAAEEVARRVIIRDDVDLAVAIPGHANPELGTVAPHDLREMARLQGRRLLAVLVMRLFRVPVRFADPVLDDVRRR
jgi:hypothetical protein